MNHVGFIKHYTAQGEIPQNRIVAFGASEGSVKLATSDAGIFGVSGIRGAKDGAGLDVYLDQFRPVKFGGTIAFGDPVTADAQGRAVKAQPAPGATMFIIGFAQASGPEGAIGDVHISPQQITG
jgi:hypothetical protein